MKKSVKRIAAMAAALAVSAPLAGMAFYWTGSNVNETFENQTYTGDEFAVDNGATVTLKNSTVNVDSDCFTTEGGSIKLENTAVTSGAWVNRSNGQGGKLTMSGGSLSGDYLAVQGEGSEFSATGSAEINVKNLISTNVVTIDGAVKETTTDGGTISLSDGAKLTAETLSLTKSTVTVSGASALKVTNGGTVADSTLTVDGGGTTTDNIELNNVAISGSTVLTVTNGGTLDVWDSDVTAGTIKASNTAGSNGLSYISMDGKINADKLILENDSEIFIGKDEGESGTTDLTLGEISMKGGMVRISLTDSAKVTGNVQIESGEGSTYKNGALYVTGVSMEIDDTLSVGENASVEADGTFDVKGGIQQLAGSTVTLNGGGTLTGTADQSALYIKGEKAVFTGTDVTFTGGEVAVDDGAKLSLTGGTVDAPADCFTTEGGYIYASGTTINSGVWANDGGFVNLDACTVNGGTIGAVDDGQIIMDIYDGKSVSVDTLYADAGIVANAWLTETAADDPSGSLTVKDVKIENNGQIALEQSLPSITVTGDVTVESGGYFLVFVNPMEKGYYETNPLAVKGNMSLNDGGLYISGYDASVFEGSEDAGVTEYAKVTVEGNITATGDSQIVVGTMAEDALMNALSGDPYNEYNGYASLVVNGDVTLSDTSYLSVEGDESTADVYGTMTLSDDAAVYVDGAKLTFASSSELHLATAGTETASLFSLRAAPTAALTATNGGQIVFKSGSKAYTTADEDNVVQTVAAADADSSITVEDGAGLYVENAKADGTKYDISKATTKEGESAIEDTGWNGDVYGDSQRMKMVKEENGEIGTFEIADFAETYTGLMAASAIQAAYDAGENSASEFIEAVEAANRTGDTAADNANVTNALNAVTGLSGLAGVGYGMTAFTQDFQTLLRNHKVEAHSLWADYLHDKRTVDGLRTGNLVSDYKISYNGVVIGSDFYKKGNLQLGAAFAYADGESSTRSGVYTKNEADYYGGSLYGVFEGGAGMTYRAELGFGRSSNDITQKNTGTTITGKTHADAFHVSVAAEKTIEMAHGMLTPFVGLGFTNIAVDDYTDSLGFRHGSDSAGVWHMPIGVSYRGTSAREGWNLVPTAALGYRFAFGDKELNETVSYGGTGSGFNTEIAESAFFASLGLEAVKDNVSFGVRYGYEKGSDTKSGAWGVNLAYRF